MKMPQQGCSRISFYQKLVLRSFLELIICVCLIPWVVAFNIDTTHPIIYNGPANSYFGFSVGLHKNPDGFWVLAGAPKANSSRQPTIKEPGALFKCNVHGEHKCQILPLGQADDEMVTSGSIRYREIQSGQWLGVSLDNQPGENGTIVVCGHRWMDDKYRDMYMLNGVCYVTDTYGNSSSVEKKLPLVEKRKQIVPGTGIYNYGLGMAGVSAHYTQEGSLLIGAPGVYDWTGAVVEYTEGQRKLVARPTTEPQDTYIGYAVTSGKFRFDGVTHIVAGGPRWNNVGKVFIYHSDFQVLVEKEGSQIGAGFGSAVCAVDMNNDGLDDLLVGAPLYAGLLHEEGRVFIYINRGLGILEEREPLAGNRKRAARFGSAISAIGDLNKDGFQDVAIGAPYEDDLRGAIYIYHGNKEGMDYKNYQRIRSRDISSSLYGFGCAISRGTDVDDNHYPDIAVGAYSSNQVVLLRSKPVIYLDVQLVIEPKQIDLNHTNCDSGYGKLATCVGVSVSFMYQGEAIPDSISIHYELWADSLLSLRKRAQFVTRHGQSHHIKRHKRLQIDKRNTQNHFKVLISDNVRDFLTPVEFTISYKVNSGVLNCIFCPELDAYKPTTISKQAIFVRDCGNDDICETDLQLKAQPVFPTTSRYGSIVLGQKNPLGLGITLVNNGEPAYAAEVVIHLPRNTSFVRVVKDKGLGSVACKPKWDAQNLITGSDIICDVANPMSAYASASFSVEVDVSTLSINTKLLDITIEASTGSQEHNHSLHDNVVKIELSTTIEADFALMGVSKPDQMLFDSMSNNTDDVGSLVEHVYDIRNLGPGLVPQSYVDVMIPFFTPKSRRFLEIMTAFVQTTNEFGRTKHIPCQMAPPAIPNNLALEGEMFSTTQTNLSDTSNAARGPRLAKWQLVYKRLETVTLDCSSGQCAEVKCYLGDMKPGDNALVKIQMKVNMMAIAEIKGANGVAMTSEAMVYTSDRSRVMEGASSFSHGQVVTHFYSDKPVKTGNIPWWLLASSGAGGFLLLVILILILVKCGFFRRKEKEELQKLIRESLGEANSVFRQDSDDESQGLTGPASRQDEPGAWGSPVNGRVRNIPGPIWVTAPPLDDSFTTEESPWIFRGVNGNGHSPRSLSGHESPMSPSGHPSPRSPSGQVTPNGSVTFTAPWTYGGLANVRHGNQNGSNQLRTPMRNGNLRNNRRP